MKCNDFQMRVQQLLDDRSVPAEDPQIRSHARQCADCGEYLQVWDQIATVVRPMPTVESRTFGFSRFGAGLAAAAVLVLMLQWGFRTEQSTLTANAPSTGENKPFAVASVDVDPLRWWHDVNDRNWVAETMPAVKGVRQRVAPLGRSLLQAVTILTVPGTNGTT